MKKKIELLAPVGGLDQFFAAVENGADAVYMGGNKFNARMKAENFSKEQLIEVIRYAHLRNVKVYITVNTLLSDEELPSAAEYCAELYSMGADAIMIQDLGLVRWIKENLPNLPMYFSTQGTVYNLSGVRTAEALGLSRVVLARETSLEEVKKITSSCNMEIEVFVHGALCMCYSGQCQMSRVVGGINGMSGNKGLCAQPCRLPYFDENGKEYYPLSPKDLCSIDYLGEIIEAGVASIKIEGRMKSPEYVAIVTRIYRKYLDEYYKKGRYEVSDEDREALRQIFSRGEFSTGYLFDNPKEKLLTDSIPKHQGIKIGEVVDVPSKNKLIDVKLTQPLSIGDYIEIRGKTLSGNLVTYLKEIGNNIYRIGDIKTHVEKGQSIYRITQNLLNKDARSTYEGASFVDGKNYKKISIDIELILKIGESPIIEIMEGNDSFVYNDETIEVERAMNKSLEKTLAERQLRKTGSTCFDVRSVTVNLEAESTLSLSSLNKLRRDALDAYSEYKVNQVVEPVSLKYDLPENANRNIAENISNNIEVNAIVVDEDAESIEPNNISEIDEKNNQYNHNEYSKYGEKQLAFYLFDSKQIELYDFTSKMSLLGVDKARVYLPLEDFMKGKNVPEYLDPIPYISNISKGNLDAYIEKSFDNIVKAVSQTGIAVGNLGWCREFIDKGVEVYSDYGLNLYNKSAVESISAFGITPAGMSLESEPEGDWPLMITEHPLNETTLVDRKNQKYNISKASSADKWMIFKAGSKTKDKDLIKLWEAATGEFRIYISGTQ